MFIYLPGVNNLHILVACITTLLKLITILLNFKFLLNITGKFQT